MADQRQTEEFQEFLGRVFKTPEQLRNDEARLDPCDEKGVRMMLARWHFDAASNEAKENTAD